MMRLPTGLPRRCAQRLRKSARSFAGWGTGAAPIACASRIRWPGCLGSAGLGAARGIDWSWPGGNETLLKAAHPPVRDRHATGIGSNARYVFDLSDPDANRLVILGGQDGVPGSAAFLDQAELFRRAAYVEVPLRLETARAHFRHLTLMTP